MKLSKLIFPASLTIPTQELLTITNTLLILMRLFRRLKKHMAYQKMILLIMAIKSTQSLTKIIKPICKLFLITRLTSQHQIMTVKVPKGQVLLWIHQRGLFVAW